MANAEARIQTGCQSLVPVVKRVHLQQRVAPPGGNRVPDSALSGGDLDRREPETHIGGARTTVAHSFCTHLHRPGNAAQLAEQAEALDV